MKYMTKIALLALTLGISACSFETIEPATMGKVLTTQGYSPDILPPGRYTLWGRDKMIMLQTNINTYRESVDVVLKDKLTLSADVRFRGSLRKDKTVINAMFNEISAGKDDIVTFNEVYAVYGLMAVRNKTREVISRYSVEDVHKNYERLSVEIGAALKEELKDTPLEISDVALGSIKYPEVVTSAINAAKERDLAIQKEQAQAKIQLVKKKNERVLAEADYQIKITNAKAVRDSNKIIGQGITPALLQLRALEVQEKMSDNENVVFMPFEAMQTTGAQIRMFNK